MTRPVISALHIGSQLGEGQFGKVYEGLHPIHGSVAVKVLERLQNEPEREWNLRKEHLLVEGRRLKDAEHDRVVRVFDVSHDAHTDRVYLVLELCPQGSLEDFYVTGPLTLCSVRDWITDVALGLDCIHSRNLIHRDIKPANILIGADGRAKLGDFGLATDRLILGYGSMRGYSDHIAPEVWLNRRTSIRSDIWALGMTIYRLLHGQTFYDEHARPRDRHMVSRGGYAARLRWLPHVPKAWRSLVRKCMHDDPNRRYHNAQQVLSALASLPVTDEWSCEYTSSRVTWKLEYEKRVRIVTHEIYSPGHHEWHAVSVPRTLPGRNRKLAGSDGVVNKNTAVRGLEEFFGST